jgi:hypothetical protein
MPSNQHREVAKKSKNQNVLENIRMEKNKWIVLSSFKCKITDIGLFQAYFSNIFF